MKGFIGGVIVGIAFAALPARADYYYPQLDRIVTALERIAVALERPVPQQPRVICKNSVGATIPCVEKP